MMRFGRAADASALAAPHSERMAYAAHHRLSRPEPEQHLLAVKLAGPRGERWAAIGAGESLDEALQWALESAPAGVAWLVSGWRDLYDD
jgi:hypothetical protein